MGKPEIKIIIVDDHEVVRQGLIYLLKDEPAVNILCYAEDGKVLLERLKVFNPDVILMDIDMPNLDGIEASKIVKKEFPGIKIIILSVYKEIGLVFKLKEIGVDGYMLKNACKEDLVKAIEAVHSGKTYYSPEITENLISSMADEKSNKIVSYNLTNREVEVLKLIAEGYTNSGIGEKLFISPRTVDTHRNNLMKKLEIHNVAGLVKFAIKNKLVE